MRAGPADSHLTHVLFDMDGVITETARAHAAAWKRLFDEYLPDDQPRFDIRRDYRRYVDGKPRSDGVRSFLASRGIELPEGSPDDAPDRETVCGLGNRKNRYFHEWLDANDVRPLPGAAAFVRRLRDAGIGVGVFSSSRNAEAVLRSAGVLDLFAARVDGVDLERLGMAGKPDPAMLLEAADRLGADPARTAIIEDALAGVDAGRRGGFGYVAGVSAAGSDSPQADALRAAGADAVLAALSELHVNGGRLVVKTLGKLPPVWPSTKQVAARLEEREPVLFLDYDGTLTPIVEDYREATLPGETRELMDALSRRVRTAVVSGRDLEDVRQLVGLDSLYYAGSHGFDMAGPDDWRDRPGQADHFLPRLDDAESALRMAADGIDGCMVERKAFSIAVHYRRVGKDDLTAVERLVERVAERHPDLRVGHGKKIYELQPDTDWHKGRAVEWLLRRFGMDDDGALPIYIGDDVTDENAFRAVFGQGLGIVVGRGARQTSAEYALEDPGDVRRFLRLLLEAWTNGD